MQRSAKRNVMKRLYEYAIQFVKFGLVGVLNNVISLIVYYMVIFFSPEIYLVGNAMGFLVSTLNAYILNSKFVFSTGQRASNAKSTLAKTYVMYTVSLIMSTGILYLLVDVLEIHEKIAPIISLMITVPFNFIVSKLWVYKRKG